MTKENKMIRITKVDNIIDLNKSVGPGALGAFLYKHLERFRDDHLSIEKAIAYVTDPSPERGGFILLAKDNGELAGTLVMLRTGMSDFVPQNLLVYIAVDSAKRGKGIGGKLMAKAKELCEGDIALHVEPDNPARHLYERQGFASKYLEMRWIRG